VSMCAVYDSLETYVPDFSDVTSTLPREAFGALSPLLRGLDLAPPISRTNTVLAEVNKRHRAGQVVTAADTLLHYLVELLDEPDTTTLNELIGALRASLYDRRNADLYDDRGLARLHNVLALTLRSADKLPARAALRTAYRDAVERREGTDVANDAVRLL
jgi:hypothetical protein